MFDVNICTVLAQRDKDNTDTKGLVNIRWKKTVQTAQNQKLANTKEKGVVVKLYGIMSSAIRNSKQKWKH